MAEERKAGAEPGVGDVQIELDDQGTVVLRPTYEACLAVSRIAGGLTAAIMRCRNLDIETIVEIISIGVGANPSMRDRIVGPAVFRTGVINLAPACVRFIRIVANGGRPPPDEGDDQQRPLGESGSASGNITSG
jgi:hypothetical protein